MPNSELDELRTKLQAMLDSVPAYDTVKMRADATLEVAFFGAYEDGHMLCENLTPEDEGGRALPAADMSLEEAIRGLAICARNRYEYLEPFKGKTRLKRAEHFEMLMNALTRLAVAEG